MLNTILSLNAQVTPQTVDTGNAAFGLLFPDVLRIYRLIGDQEPLGDSPAPWGAWEANALDAAMAGDSIPAELVQEQGKWWIRSSTALSNFDANCGVCHQNYGGPDPNQFVGALVMRIPVEQ